MKRCSMLLLMFILVVVCPATVKAQTSVPAVAPGSGGGSAGNSSFRLSGTLGQPVVGPVSNSATRHSAGFWPVAAWRRAPVALTQTVTTTQATDVNVILHATDSGGNALRYRVVTPPAHGVLSGVAPTLTYTPAADFVGSDSFTFVANGGYADSNLATVSLVVRANRTPITIAVDAQPHSKTNFTFNGTLGLFRLDDSQPDDGDAYSQRKTFVVAPGTYTITAQPLSAWPLMAITCTPAANGVVDLATGKVTITVTTGDNVTCTFTNQRAGKLTVGKYNDLNRNRVRNANDPWLSGWTMQLFTSPDTQVGSQTTDSNGRAIFLNLRPGAYTVCEVQQSGWFHITPATLNPAYQKPCYSVTINPSQAVAVRFGNSTTPLTLAAEADDLTDLIVIDLPDTDDEGNEVTPLPDPWPEAPAEGANTLFLPLVMQ